jgi:hypothetical protein
MKRSFIRDAGRGSKSLHLQAVENRAFVYLQETVKVSFFFLSGVEVQGEQQ